VVSALMELVNELYQFSEAHTIQGVPAGRSDGNTAAGERDATLAVLKEAIESLVLMMSPFTPHMAEELWELLGHEGGIAFAAWPVFDPVVARAEEIVIPVQVNGKVRGRVTVPADCAEDDIRAAALAAPAIASHLAGKTVRKVIVAAGRLVSIVVT
jgi:leucyl-tRNA synthetase